MSQRALAARLKVSQSWIAQIEAGQRRVNVLDLMDIAKATGVAPEGIIRRLKG